MIDGIKIFFIAAMVLCGGCKRYGNSFDYIEDLLSGDESNLALSVRSSYDAMVINDDDEFSSLAIYIYRNDGSDVLESSLLLPIFDFVDTKELEILSSIGDKSIYVIANYYGKHFESQGGDIITLDSNTTRAELDDMVVFEDGSFVSNELLMVCKEEITLKEGDDLAQMELWLSRVVARIDLYVFKADNLSEYDVTLNSVRLCNQVMNSEVPFDSNGDMITPTVFNDMTINSGVDLSLYSGDVAELTPSQAQSIFYSYQNIVDSESSITPNTAPYLEVEISLDGSIFTYGTYITDSSQIEGKYSLLQSNLYQVVAVLDAEGVVDFSVDVIDWSNCDIDVNIEGSVSYLNLSETNITMSNISSYKITYASDSPITITNVAARDTRYDDYGVAQEEVFVSGDEEFPIFDIDTSTNTITIESAIPDNYVPKDISFTVTTEMGHSLDVSVIQYPKIYVTARISTGNVAPEFYSGGTNLNLFTVNIIAPSDDDSYLLGDPTLGASYTNTTAEMNRVASPQFIIASQYGIYSTVTYYYAYMRCLEYGEDIYRTGWRLPSMAEVEIINMIQDDPDSAIDDLLGGATYWSAYTYKYFNFENDAWISGSSLSEAYVRAVYDLYLHGDDY